LATTATNINVNGRTTIMTTIATITTTTTTTTNSSNTINNDIASII
jgi:hypothetical protein